MGLFDKLVAGILPKPSPITKTDKLVAPIVQWNVSEKALNPYYGVVGGTFMAQTGQPWLASDARKAVLTEWFWQPIRGQPRRVDTNELRKYANTIWVQAIVQTILNQIASVPWDIIPKEEYSYEEVQEEIKSAKEFLENINKNGENFNDVIRACVKDVLEIDAGVLVKVYTYDSYDFEHLEPRSGAPLLKPLYCPECEGKKYLEKSCACDKAKRTLKSIELMKSKLPDSIKAKLSLDKDLVKEMDYQIIKPDFIETENEMVQIISANSPNDENYVGFSPSFGLKQEPTLVLCPFCKGTGLGRHMTEVYCRDGASFLKDVDRTGWIYGYWQYSYSIPAHPMWFYPDEIVYFSQTPRSMSPYGWSAVQSTLETIKTLEYSTKHNMNMLINGAVPSGIVSVEDMDTDELKKMATQWENELKGQSHKTIFMNKKTAYQSFAFNNRDMQYTEGQKEAWKQVIAAFNLTPADLGMTEDLNRATAGNQTELSRRKAIRPIIKKIEYKLNKEILPELGTEKVQFSYIVDDPTEERMTAELNQLYLNMGVKSVEMVQNEMGLPAVGTFNNSLMSQLADLGLPMGDKPQEEKEIQANSKEVQEQPKEVAEKSAKTQVQATVPFVTTVQNLSQSTPSFALPPNGHVNTIPPYNQLGGLCPGCGKPSLQPVEGAGNQGVKIMACIYCNRQYNEEQLAQAVGAQRMGQNLAMLSGNNQDLHPLDRIAREIENYTEQMGNRMQGKAWTHRYYQSDLQKGVLSNIMETVASQINDLRAWLGFEPDVYKKSALEFIEEYGFDLVDVSAKKLKQLKEIFKQTFERGYDIPHTTDMIMELGFDQIEAERIARTETTRIGNAAKILDAQEKGFKKLKWVASKDKALCETCASHDGKVYSLKAAVGKIPAHPNCRCTFEVVREHEGGK